MLAVIIFIIKHFPSKKQEKTMQIQEIFHIDYYDSSAKTT